MYFLSIINTSFVFYIKKNDYSASLSMWSLELESNLVVLFLDSVVFLAITYWVMLFMHDRPCLILYM